MDIDIHVLSYFVAIYSFDRKIRNDMVAGLKRKVYMGRVQQPTNCRRTSLLGCFKMFEVPRFPNKTVIEVRPTDDRWTLVRN